jgi:DHA2 family multidrug resistance protein
MSGAIWISVLHTMTIRNSSAVKSRLGEGIRPDNPLLDLKAPGFDVYAPETMAGMDFEILRQALMVAYVDTYWFLTIACLVAAPLILFLRRSS